MQITTIGLDLAKSVFQVHGVDAVGQVVIRKKLRRAEVLKFFRGWRRAWSVGRHLGPSIGHASPEAAEGGTIGLVEDGDRIEIDIPARTIRLTVPDEVLAARRAAMEARGDAAWRPAAPRSRQVSTALQAYAAFATSAARGAVRDVGNLRRRS